MGKVFCFGELLLRMSPPPGLQWIEEAAMPCYIGGAELNVATALANWETPVKYCTALPDNYLSDEIIEYLDEKKIDSSPIQRMGDRIGIYYLPQGSDLKHAGVIYDRAHSSFSELSPGVIDWDKELNDCSWFHFSAISPALNQHIAAVCKEALEAATAKGLTISVDLNYRSRLWQYGKRPIEIMPGLLPYCQVVMGNIWAAEELLGFTATIKDSKGKSTKELIDAGGKSMKQIYLHYPNVMTIAYTFRLESEYFGVIQHGPKMAVSKHFPLENIVDKVGSGDCFMAGLIFGLLQKHAPQDIIDFAAAAAIGKLQEKGDASNNNVQDVLNILRKEWSGTNQS